MLASDAVAVEAVLPFVEGLLSFQQDAFVHLNASDPTDQCLLVEH